MAAPSISLPKGGGAIRGIGEKFAANPVTGTGSMSVPIATSPGRSGFGPQLSLSYDSGAGNGPFGLGWNLSLPSITRRTDKGLPQYRDDEESDVFILSGAEDLVPVYKKNSDGSWAHDPLGHLDDDEESRNGYLVKRYRPRIEWLFARIERWTRIADPANPSHVFSWLICQSYDDKGNAIVHQFVAENDGNVALTQVNERNRLGSTNRYLKYIRYENRQPLLIDSTRPASVTPTYPCAHTGFQQRGLEFEVVFDYGDARSKWGRPPAAFGDCDGQIGRRHLCQQSTTWPILRV
ncbi:MAG: SpvB/TcaC N-terminal domain-containing protein [Nitrospira sp.]